MPLFRRPKTEHPEPASVASAPVFAVPEGTEQCTEKGCPSHKALRCYYVDRRGNVCSTAWCPQHWVVAAGGIYCRRHASTISALGENAGDPLGLPDLKNRGPSLVNWVSTDLDPSIRSILESMMRPGELVNFDASVRTVYDTNRHRRYERAWKVVHHTGVNLKVGIYVDEEDDSQILVRVGQGVVAKGVPPWIARRRRGVTVGDDVDQAERQLFYGFLLEHIGAAIQKQRQFT